MYEPMVVLLDGQTLLTSRAAANGTVPHDARRYHKACFARVEGDGRPDSA